MGAKRAPVHFLLPAVAVSAWVGRLGPAVLAIVASATTAQWSFIGPVESRFFHSLGDLAAVMSFVVACGFIVSAIELMHRANHRAFEDQKALLESERVFRALVSASSQSVWHYRPGAASNKRLDEGGAAWWREFTGQSENEQTADGGTGWLSAVHEDDREKARLVWLKITSNLEPAKVEYRVRRRDGVWRWLRFQGVPIRDMRGAVSSIAGVVVDISEEKHAEERFRLAVESAPSAMILVDQSGKIVLINNQTEKLFGYTREELIGRSLEMLLPERFRSHHPGLRASFFSTPQSRAIGLGRDLYGLRKDGTEIMVEVGLNPMKSDEGNFVMAAVLDVTQRKRLQGELEEAVRTREEFLSIASHELKTPLTSVQLQIQGLLRLVQREDKALLDSDRGGQMLQNAKRAGDRLAMLINDLLDVSRIMAHKLKLEPVEMDLADSPIDRRNVQRRPDGQGG